MMWIIRGSSSLSILLLLACSGCRRDKQLIDLQYEVNRAASELVVQDAAARRDWMSMQAELDAQRREITNRERSDPIVAQAILQISGIALCLLPLIVIARLLRRSESEPELIVLEELVSEDAAPKLPSPEAKAHDLTALIEDRLSRSGD